MYLRYMLITPKLDMLFFKSILACLTLDTQDARQNMPNVIALLSYPYPSQRPTAPPTPSRSSKKVSCPKRLLSSPNSICVTCSLPARLNVSAISRCCHAGKRISLATPRTRVGIFAIGTIPSMRSWDGALGSEIEFSDKTDSLASSTSLYGVLGNVRLHSSLID